MDGNAASSGAAAAQDDVVPRLQIATGDKMANTYVLNSVCYGIKVGCFRFEYMIFNFSLHSPFINFKIPILITVPGIKHSPNFTATTSY